MVPVVNGHHAQIMKGVLEMCLLAIIVEETSYGYGMVQRLNESGWVIANEGSIYPVLKRLKTQGFIDSELVDSSSGPARKYYSSTDQGREMLQYWMADWHSVRDGVDAVLSASTNSAKKTAKNKAKKSSVKHTKSKRKGVKQ